MSAPRRLAAFALCVLGSVQCLPGSSAAAQQHSGSLPVEHGQTDWLGQRSKRLVNPGPVGQLAGATQCKGQNYRFRVKFLYWRVRDTYFLIHLTLWASNEKNENTRDMGFAARLTLRRFRFTHMFRSL